ncbi:hypothetical protein SGLAD_v1c09640 [Spiroplasma gladiatoris]|uniref:Uncharacterized protein n=1 Tax=Spiroplasma gladiatoris TaxID=2143 RepID=A0A4P7AK71_9MOLU|nr:hypothetical protein [Spiroplasma gladiatoris]QBQ08163.1 hypothetical protein SGLAD_v1c09640 [Spiroplasma gladiatoris]
MKQENKKLKIYKWRNLLITSLVLLGVLIAFYVKDKIILENEIIKNAIYSILLVFAGCMIISGALFIFYTKFWLQKYKISFFQTYQAIKVFYLFIFNRKLINIFLKKIHWWA